MTRILRFTASWCQPCKMLSKSFEQLDIEIPVEVYDIDEQGDVAMDFGIRSVPTLIMMDGNTELKRISKALNPTQLKEWITQTQ